MKITNAMSKEHKKLDMTHSFCPVCFEAGEEKGFEDGFEMGCKSIPVNERFKKLSKKFKAELKKEREAGRQERLSKVIREIEKKRKNLTKFHCSQCNKWGCNDVDIHEKEMYDDVLSLLKKETDV